MVFIRNDSREECRGAGVSRDGGRMGPGKREGGGKRKEITVEVKKEIIEKHESGMRVADLARFYDKSTSTICTILKNKEEIRRLRVAKGVTRVSKQRPRVLDDVENLLLSWINEKRAAGATPSKDAICEKAKALYEEMTPGTSAGEDFKASRGWFVNFSRRSGLRSAGRRGGGARTAEDFVAEFGSLVAREGYLPQQVFNCDETALFWRRMPKRTFLATEEAASFGHRPSKDRLALLLCGNASGDFKAKPLLVYHSENPRAFRRCKVQKSRLNVAWRSNGRAWVTGILLVEWINEVFGPAVREYLQERNLPLKVLLLMDDAPAHVPDLEDDLLEEFSFVKVKLFPGAAGPTLQPMEQGIASGFKKLYAKSLFERCLEVSQGTELGLREFWRNHFHIVSSLKLIDKAWTGLSRRTLNSAWKKLWPGCVEGPAREAEPGVLEEIVSLGARMGLEVSAEDVLELVEDEGPEADAEDLAALRREEEREEASEGEEEPLTESGIREMCRMWEAVQEFVERYHPSKGVAMRAVNSFNDNAMSHFREILRRRQTEDSPDGLVENPVKVEIVSGEPTDDAEFFTWDCKMEAT